MFLNCLKIKIKFVILKKQKQSMKYKPLIIGTVIYYLLMSYIFATFNLIELSQKDRGIIAICYMWVIIIYCILKWLLEQDKE